MARQEQPPIQLIASLVITEPGGGVLPVRSDPEDERWWLKARRAGRPSAGMPSTASSNMPASRS